MYNFSNTKNGETLVSIIVGVVILGIAISGITMILIQSRAIEADYDSNNFMTILQSNAENIVRNIDTTAFGEKDIFYIQKDVETKMFRALSGSTNEPYRYINKHGDVVDPVTYIGPVYSRLFIVEKSDVSMGKPRQIIKGGIKEFIKK